MKSRRNLIVISLLALLGVSGYVLFGRRGPKTPQAGAADPAKAAAAKAGAPPGTSALRPPSDLNVLVDDDKEGTLRLEGIVLDGKEQPVAGAVVTVSTNPPRTATSEADGSFAFDKLLARPYTLVARADAGVAGPVTARLSAKSDPVTLRLRPAASVEVTVVSAADRKPVAGATVELRDLETIAGTTDGEGKVVFGAVAPGGYQAVAWAPGHARSFAWVRVPRADASGTVVERVTLSLRRGAPVAGVVRDPGGAPVKGALVSYQSVSEWTQRPDQRRDAVVTDGEGRYRFEALPAGTFRFVARAEGFAAGTSPQVTLSGEAERTGIDITLEAGATIAGTVVDKQGAPVPHAVVRVVARIEGFSFDDARQTACDETGHFEMTGLPRKKLDAVALGDSASSATVEIDMTQANERRDLVITLDNEATISGIVVDAQGQPIAEASVSAFPSFRGRGARGREARRDARFDFRLRGGTEDLTDQGGRFVLRGLADGDYTVRATRPGKARSFARDGVEASTGDAEVKIVLESDGGAKGRVLRADGSAPELFSVSVGGGPMGGPFMGGGTPFASPDGTFQLDDVPPGERTFTVTGPDFERKQVTAKIESDKVTDLGTINVVEGRKIVGRVLDPSGAPVPNAQVVAGRRLFASGGSLAAGGGGAPGRGGATRTATSDERGAFVIYGAPPQDLAMAAEHETLGRSPTVLLPGSNQDSTIDLVIQPFGALEGVVRKDGAPVEGVAVNVTAQNVPNTNFVVQTGPDGAFRFDRLAPDVYLVQGTGGQGPGMMRGATFTTVLVTVKPRETARAIIDMKTGSTVRVKVVLKSGEAMGPALLRAAGGPVQSKVYATLEAEIAKLGAVFSGFAPAISGQDAVIPDVPPGKISVCAVPFPAEVRGMGAIFEYMDRAAAALPVHCSVVEVAAGADVAVTITIDALPAYVPPPGEQTPGAPVAPGNGRGGGGT